ncbi:hypothetical protein L7F22_032956 [Adiantum nelumboides]|nr:hypothetical protein [Adiantum nelumboides]
MAAPQSSVSSRNQAVEGLVLSSGAGRRTDHLTAHECYDLASDASNKPPSPPLKSVTLCIGIASNAFKINSPLPKNASLTSVIHSSWIQRLKPTSHRCTTKDEPPIFSKKESFVCTHFTKDYSSCSRRLNKFSHHTRSASWPPHGSQSEVARQLALDVEKPACHYPVEHYTTETTPAHLNHQNFCLRLKDASQSSEAGSRTGRQKDSQKYFCPLEGFVPCAQLIAANRKPHNLQVSNEREHGSCSGQQFQNHIKGEVQSEFVALFEQRDTQVWSQVVKEDNCAYFVSAPPQPVSARGDGYSSGASADADGSNHCDKPLTFGDLSGNKTAQSGCGDFHSRGQYAAVDASREKQKLDKFGLIIPRKEEAERDGLSAGLKDTVELNLPQPRQNFNLFKGKGYLRNGLSTRQPGNSQLSHFIYQRPGASTRDDTTTCRDDIGTVRTSALKSQNLMATRMDAAHTSHNPHPGEVGRASKSPVFIRSLYEDAARVRIREKSLGDYWNSWDRLLEEQDPGRPINMGHSKAFLQEDFATGYCWEDYCQQPLRTKQITENFNSCKSQKANFSNNSGAYDSEEQKLFLRKLSDPRTKSRQLITSSEYTSTFVVDHLEGFQEPYLYSHEGASGRVDSQIPNKHSVRFLRCWKFLFF